VNNQSDEQPSQVEQRARQLFDNSVASLDARTLSRLNRARQGALEVARKDRMVMPRWLVPVGSVAALALIVTVSVRMIGTNVVKPEIDSRIEDMEIIASNEELDLLQDVDFYDSLDAVETSDGEAS